VRRIPKLGIRLPTNLLPILKKIRTNPIRIRFPKIKKKIRQLLIVQRDIKLGLELASVLKFELTGSNWHIFLLGICQRKSMLKVARF
jgi:hypothetical protein